MRHTTWQVKTRTYLKMFGRKIYMPIFTFEVKFDRAVNYTDAFTHIAMKYKKSNAFFVTFVYALAPVTK
jgi:hypothetical protein